MKARGLSTPKKPVQAKPEAKAVPSKKVVLPAPKAVSMNDQFDERTEKNIKTLHPFVQAKAREFMKRALFAGFNVKIISGTRTYAEQNALYAQGRTKPGAIVTNARGGYSNHNFGVAFDVGIFTKEGAYLGESPLYRNLSVIAKAVGFNWGGDWKSMKDEPHYEWPTGLTLAQMRQRIADGKPILV